MFDLQFLFVLLVAISLIFVGQILIFWVTKKSGIIDIDPLGMFKKKKKKQYNTENICEHCGEDNPRDKNICSNCGKPL